MVRPAIPRSRISAMTEAGNRILLVDAPFQRHQALTHEAPNCHPKLFEQIAVETGFFRCKNGHHAAFSRSHHHRLDFPRKVDKARTEIVFKTARPRSLRSARHN